MQFLSDEWLDALRSAAASRPVDEATAGLRLDVEHVVDGGRSWRMAFRDGRVEVHDLETAPSGPPPAGTIRLGSDGATAAAIARGERSALDAFIAGDLRISGDSSLLLDQRQALEAVGDLFAEVKANTTF